jgi:hypothetical protein
MDRYLIIVGDCAGERGSYECRGFAEVRRVVHFLAELLDKRTHRIVVNNRDRMDVDSDGLTDDERDELP